MPTILVTGGSGRLGHATLEVLVRRWPGRQILSLDRVPPTEKISGVRYLTGCLESPNADLVRILRAAGPLEVVWLAARILIEPAALGELEELIAANVRGPVGTLAVIEGHARRLVYASSVEVYGEPNPTSTPFVEDQPLRPITAYGISKALGERFVQLWCRRRSVPLVVLRLTSLYGPGEPLPKAITDFLMLAGAGREIVVHGDGSSLRDYLYLTDAAEAVVHALASAASGTFNLASPERVSLARLAETAIEVCGRGTIRFLRPEAPRRDRVMDVSRMTNELGFRCAVSVREGLERVAESEGLL